VYVKLGVFREFFIVRIRERYGDIEISIEEGCLIICILVLIWVI
jgi:hypothetical protein